MGHVLLLCRCGEQTVPADEIQVYDSGWSWLLGWACPCGNDILAYISEPLATAVLSWQREGKERAVAEFRQQIETCDDLVSAITQGGGA